MTRRTHQRLAPGLALLCTGLALLGTAGCATTRGSAPPSPEAAPLTAYVGTYTGGGSRGIHRFHLDPASGTWTDPVLVAETENPSYLAFHPDGRVLYAVNETATFGGARTGAVSAFAIDGASGDLTLLAQQASGGADPCHLSVDKGGQNVLVANYTGGSVAVLPVGEDGRLQPASHVRRHQGSGPVRGRQDGPHAHSVVLDGSERIALAADLGADRIFLYRFDGSSGRLEPNDPASVVLEPGSGPRHLAWHPSGKVLYAVNELNSTVTAFRTDPQDGALVSFQTVTTLPDGFSGASTAAEVVVSPDGRFLHASNRGADDIAVFRIDATSGVLEPSGHHPTGGRGPRHFAIDPSGTWLLAANQESGSVVVFRRDRSTGRLTPVGNPLAISKPACVLFAPPRR